MKLEQQRIAIAEACGWTKRLMRQGDAFFDSSMSRIALPDYLNSLDAMHEAEKVIIQRGLMGGFDGYHNTLCGIIDDGNAIHATAAQRAEAFLRTLNQWIED